MYKYLFAALLAGSVAVSTANASPTAQLAGGRTSVWLSHDFVDALVTLGVSPSAISPGSLSLRRGLVRYPIPAGVIDLDTLKGDVFHSGGLALEAGGTKVSLYNFVISTTGSTPVLTGIAAVNGNIVDRIPLFDLALTKDPRVTRWGGLRLGAVDVTLNPVAAETLNAVFGIEAFSGGFPIGTAYLRSHITGVDYEDADEDDDEDDH
jgi:hypothetical protein